MHTFDIAPAADGTVQYWAWAVEPDWVVGVAYESVPVAGATVSMQGSLSELGGGTPHYADLVPDGRGGAYYARNTHAPFAHLKVSADAAGCAVRVRCEGVLVQVDSSGVRV